MEILLISGFLGSGKTTLIKHLLTSQIQKFGKVALIVNEVGDVGIDGTLLSGQDVDMVEITSGCICCTIKTDFSRAVQEIHDRVDPDFLIVEATGVAQPGDILDALFEPPMSEYSRLRGLVTVVDADIFKAREIFGTFYNNQIQSADTLILNKVDLIEPQSLQEIEALLGEMNPGARILPTPDCAVAPPLLLQGDPDVPSGHPHGHHDHGSFDEMGFQTFSFEDERPMHKEKLIEFLESLSPTLFRLKGWVRFPDVSAHLDFTGGRYSIRPMDGPRATALTFVGRNCSETQILEALEDCLVDDREVNGAS
ncbi:MAG: GTP-binding protein [Desulfatiglandales bacterium]